ncbi:MAG: tRNA preQ1(34) S-adenosylmethionine ribosyltransferase-isomerase QueA [Thermodesulfobacteriota bacterium]|nr:tRNA preQ1(34) S-adenosylmethionine ribosyltransferase-isomerase QueA [Thermodesulfobacteriota bacterium]
MIADFSLVEYDYYLPPHLIAQYPLDNRSSSRLMVLDRNTGKVSHRTFRDLLDYMEPGDCLVLNDSKVFPARLNCIKSTGGKIEFFLLHFPRESGNGVALARALCRSSKPVRPGQKIRCKGSLKIEVMEVSSAGQVDIKLVYQGELLSALKSCGDIPLPPYIKRSPVPSDVEKYQTIYAKEIGSVAAPTAGFHFTEEQLLLTEKKNINIAWITLHVGYGTFAPVRKSDIREHSIHHEWISVPESTVKKIISTRRTGGRVIAVGTTTVRALEATVNGTGEINTFQGLCDLYILPGRPFQIVDCLITNFHLPNSSLLILVSAFAGRGWILSAYKKAINAEYRFFSYGDAMLII